MGAAVGSAAYGSAPHELREVSAVLGVPSEPETEERLESWCRECCVERTRQWRRAHPEHKSRRPRVAPSKLTCVECGASFEGRKDRLVCSRRCKDRRYARLHPDRLREKKRRRAERLAA